MFRHSTPPPTTPGCSLPPAKSPAKHTLPPHTLSPPGRPAAWPKTLSCLCLIRGGCHQLKGSTFHFNTIWKAAHQVAQLGLTCGRGGRRAWSDKRSPPPPTSPHSPPWPGAPPWPAGLTWHNDNIMCPYETLTLASLVCPFPRVKRRIPTVLA